LLIIDVWFAEKATAAVAAEYGSLFSLSSLATTSIADAAAVLPEGHPKLFQLYVWRDRELVRDVLAQAKEGGYTALALTVDFTWYGNRERDIRNGFTIPVKYTPQVGPFSCANTVNC
jgi:isopentenyl diphosphate isomerase/L-lactate dehydrogenase-like FMN-dependent dehydrogenase